MLKHITHTDPPMLMLWARKRKTTYFSPTLTFEISMVESSRFCNMMCSGAAMEEHARQRGKWAIYHEEEVRMRRRLAAAALILGAVAFVGTGISWAEKSHLVEATEHTQAAVEHGKAGHADVLATHATEALKHAEAAEKAKANPHTAAAIKELKGAVEHGKANHADVATKAAEEALGHLKAVK
jgi:cell division protein FtsB